MSKKLLTGILLASLLGLSWGSLVLATQPTETPEVLPEWTTREVLQLIDRITNWIFTFLIAVVVIMVLVGAYLFVTAGGNPDRRAKATQVVLYALVGFAIGMLARGVIALVSTVIGKSAQWKWKMEATQ